MNYLHKGDRVTVAGSAKVRIYDKKKDNSEGKSLELNVTDFTLPPRQQIQALTFNRAGTRSITPRLPFYDKTNHQTSAARGLAGLGSQPRRDRPLLQARLEGQVVL